MSIDMPTPHSTVSSAPESTAARAAADQPKNETRQGSWVKSLVFVVLILGLLGAAAAAVFNRVSADLPTKVLAHTVERGDLTVSVTEQGTLESSSNKEIKCKVKGGSTVLWVIETGTEVKPGDVLIRLDQSVIEDNISAQKIIYENALANKATSESDVAVAKIAITEYLEGTYRSELSTKQKELVIAESNLKSAKNTLEHAQKMFRRGYISKLEMEAQQDSVKHAELEVEVKNTDLEVLQRYTKAKTLQELEGTLEVAQARLASDVAALDLEKARLEREQQQLENCIVTADVSGMVIYPSAAEWKETPDIEEGAMVREDQVLLIIPDLKRMQVKIGIHESKIDRVMLDMPARIELQDGFVDGRVGSIASVTKPTGWWNGNVVKYDTVIELTEQHRGLKPGMSVAVEVFLAQHEDVVTIPVAAVVDQGTQSLCWVQGDSGVQRRVVKLGDSNDQFVIVNEGLRQGEQVVLNPLDFIGEAQSEALKPVKQSLSAKAKDGSEPEESVSPEPQAKTPKTPTSKPDATKSAGAQIIKMADKNGDGVLTKDEFDEESKPQFDTTDADGNGEVDAAEIDAGLKRMQEASAKP